MDQRPAFELQPDENESLPSGERFTRLDQLVGHEIKVICDTPCGRFAQGQEVVIVTKTDCWLVLRPEASYTYEDGVNITTVSDYRACKGEPEQLSDYLDADQMLRLGLVNASVHAAIQAEENKRIDAHRQCRADQLRKELAKLEGGAA